MSKFLNNISLNDNQIQNFVIQNAPSGAGITAGNRKGAAYFDSTANLLYINDGSGYITYQIKNANGTVTVADPINATDAANKQYVDSAVQGISAKDAVECATTGNIANLLTGAPSTVDGFSLAVGSRVLVKDQTTQSQNGIYTVTTVGTGANGVWARAYDANIWSEIINAYVLVTNGTANASTGWVCTVPVGTGTLDTTNITWVQFSQAGIVTGANLTGGAGQGNVFSSKTGNTLNFKQLKQSGNITISEDANAITISGTGVTTITNTKGIIGFNTPTTTPDITITGTSGGIPYFNSDTTWTTSALLTARGVMLGGGAGTAPRAISALGTAGQALLSGGAGADPAFGALSLSTATSVTGILAAANGGTGSQYVTFTGATVARTYTLPNQSDTIATLGAIQTFTAAQSFNSIKFDSASSITGAAATINLFNFDVTTGSISLGGALTTGSISIANGNTFNGTINIACGLSSSTKTINIGTNNTLGGLCNIDIGSNRNTGTLTLHSPIIKMITVGGVTEGYVKRAADGTLSIETSYVKKYFTAINGAVGGVWSIAAATHGVASNQQIQVSVQISTTGEVVYPDIDISSAGMVTLVFATNPADGAYSVLLIG